MRDRACHLGSTCLSCGRFVGDRATEGEDCPHCVAGPYGERPSDDGSSPSILAVNFILYCQDWSETVSFYRDRLGLSQTFANSWFVEFRLGASVFVSVADAGRATVGAVGGQGVTLSLEVADLEKTRLGLVGREVEAGPVMNRFGASVFDVRDPEGNRIEFWERPSAVE